MFTCLRIVAPIWGSSANHDADNRDVNEAPGVNVDDPDVVVVVPELAAVVKAADVCVTGVAVEVAICD